MMRRILLLVLLLLAVPAWAESYYVPPSQFSASYKLGGASGSFANATGSFSFDRTTKTLTRLRLALDASRSAFVPGQGAAEITFVSLGSTKFENDKAEVKGALALLGVTRPASFSATISGSTPTLSLQGTFKRADFGLGEDGSGDSFTLLMDMQAIRP